MISGPASLSSLSCSSFPPFSRPQCFTHCHDSSPARSQFAFTIDLIYTEHSSDGSCITGTGLHHFTGLQEGALLPTLSQLLETHFLYSKVQLAC